MKHRRTVSRRSLLAGTSTTVVALLAGCQGDGDGQGENGTEGESGTNGTENRDGTKTTSGTEEGGETIELRGQQVVSETITDSKEWEYDMDQGDTLTAAIDPAAETMANCRIREKNDFDLLAEANPSPDDPDRMQYTAESDGTYLVDINVSTPTEDSSSVDVEIYLEE